MLRNKTLPQRRIEELIKGKWANEVEKLQVSEDQSQSEIVQNRDWYRRYRAQAAKKRAVRSKKRTR